MKLAMENMTQFRTFAKRSLGIVVLVLASTSYITQAKAQNVDVNKVVAPTSMRSPKQAPKRPRRITFIQPKLPSNGTPSGRQRGAAGRGSCLNNGNIPLTAVVPSIKTSVDNENSAIVATNVWGSTVKEHPTFLFYVPYTHPATGEFVLQSEDNDIYRSPIALPKEPGIIRLQLPPESAPLAVDKMYHWYFKVRCSQNMASPVFVEGWIQRVNLNSTVSDRLANTTSLHEQVVLYAENGIWYDTVATLAQIRLQNLEDAASSADWQNLLETIDLSTLASESIKGTDSKDKKSLISDYSSN